MAMNIDDVANYIIVKLSAAGAGLNALKLQKLLYYVQAWSLAIYEKPAFEGKFQAWVHGPVSRQVFDRFRETHSLYDRVSVRDVPVDFRLESLPQDLASHIDEVLESYARFSGSQLEEMTHREEPWIAARKGLPAATRCETEIDEGLMSRFYAKLLAEVEKEEAAAQ